MLTSFEENMKNIMKSKKLLLLGAIFLLSLLFAVNNYERAYSYVQSFANANACESGEYNACIKFATEYEGAIKSVGPIGTYGDYTSFFVPKKHFRNEDFASLQKSCEFGNPESCFSLGQFWQLAFLVEFRKLGTRRDMKIESNGPWACGSAQEVQLERLEGATSSFKGMLVKIKEKSFEAFKKACELGNGEACYEVGGFYQLGIGTSKIDKNAFESFFKSCEFKNMHGCFGLGLAYRHGIGTAENKPTDIKLFDKSVEAFKKACELGHGKVCYELGVIYQLGRGIPKDEKKAFEALSKSCELQIMHGCFELGKAYRDGTGTAEKKSKAMDLFEKSCEFKITEACDQLDKAAFQKACELGNGEACYKLWERRYQFETGNSKDDKKAFEALSKSCKLQNMHGCFELGKAFHYGI